jgi:hypothetical protein
MTSLTKTEERIINTIRNANDHRALAGLGTDPGHADFNNRTNRFVKRLYESKAIIWVPYISGLGAGWALPGVSHIGGYKIESSTP